MSQASAANCANALVDARYRWLGIPPAEQPANAYRLLGIALFEPNDDVIQAAADRQMAHVRTYQTGPQSALSQQILNELSAAAVCLLRPEKRAKYDQNLRAEIGNRAGAISLPPLQFPAAVAPIPPMQVPVPVAAQAYSPPPVSDRRDPDPSLDFLETDRPARKFIASSVRNSSGLGVVGWSVVAIIALAVFVIAVAVVSLDEQPADSEQSSSQQSPPARPIVPRSVPVRPASPPVVVGPQDSPLPLDPRNSVPNDTGSVPVTPTALLPIPGKPVPPHRDPGPANIGSEIIRLPDGRDFDIKKVFQSDFAKQANQLSQDKNDGTLVIQSKFSNGNPEFLGSERGGTLEGPVISGYESGRPATYAAYRDGKLDGNLLTWESDGRRILFAQFATGAKHGFLAVFDDQDNLYLIEEWNHDDPQWYYLVDHDAVTKSFHVERGKILDDPQLKSAIADADSTLLELHAAQYKVERHVRELDEEQRQPRAAANNAAARARIMDREGERRDNAGQMINTLRRWSGVY